MSYGPVTLVYCTHCWKVIEVHQYEKVCRSQNFGCGFCLRRALTRMPPDLEAMYRLGGAEAMRQLVDRYERYS